MDFSQTGMEIFSILERFSDLLLKMNGVMIMPRRKSFLTAILISGLAQISATAQDVIIQQQPTFIERVFAPVVETVQTITTPVTNQIYISSPGTSIVTSPSRVVTTTQVIQTQSRVIDPVFDSLSRQLRDILPDRRREAAFAMGQLRNPRAVPLLLERLRVDLNKNVRKASVVALSQIPDPSIPGYLERVAIYDPNAEVRQLASNLMKKLSEAVIVETPIEVPVSMNPVNTAIGSTIIQVPGTETVTNGPSVLNSQVQVRGGIPPTTAQVPGTFRPRTTPAGPTEIISEPIESPAVNPLAPNESRPGSEPGLKQKSPTKPSTGSVKQNPNLSPPKAAEPPPLEALPDEVPKNTRLETTPALTKPRSA